MPEPYLDAKELAAKLKFTTAFIRKMAKAGKIPGVPFKFGKKTYWRFLLSEVVAVLAADSNQYPRRLPAITPEGCHDT